MTCSLLRFGAVVLAVFIAACFARAQCPPFSTILANYSVGTNPSSLVTGDFNRDGLIDLIVANGGDNRVRLMLGQGNGAFQLQTPINVGTYPQSMVAADFNADGKLDLAVANANANSIFVFLGQGNGTFFAPTTYTLGGVPVGLLGLATGDFNNDGRPDLVAVNSNSALLWVLLSNATGTFQTPTSRACYSSPKWIAVGDMNGDGNADLVIVTIVGQVNTILVTLGTGTGTFNDLAAYRSGNTGAYSLALGDLDHDGRLDVVAANDGDGTIGVLRGVGDGTLLPTVLYNARLGSGAVAIADFNGDGHLDVAVANRENPPSGSTSVFMGRGDGTLTQASHISVPGTTVTAYAIASADFNHDGRPDLAVAHFTSNNVSILLSQSIASAVTITQQPSMRSIVIGGTGNFSISATTSTNTGALTYRWFRNGIPLTNGASATGTVFAGATTQTLTLSNTLFADNCSAFHCVVTNGCGTTATSYPAALCVLPPCPADFNSSGAANVQDIFDFLSSWFGGCA